MWWYMTLNVNSYPHQGTYQRFKLSQDVREGTFLSSFCEKYPFLSFLVSLSPYSFRIRGLVFSQYSLRILSVFLASLFLASSPLIRDLRVLSVFLPCMVFSSYSLHVLSFFPFWFLTPSPLHGLVSSSELCPLRILSTLSVFLAWFPLRTRVLSVIFPGSWPRLLSSWPRLLSWIRGE